jgi:polar amino acid transport system substrate-binding protein
MKTAKFELTRISGLSIVIFVIFFSCFFITADVFGKDLKVSLPFLPVLSETPEKGILVDLTKAMDREYEGSFKITGIYPFKRSMHNVLAAGVADLHMPILVDPDVPEDQLPYMHSTEIIFYVIFGLYTKRGRKIDMNNLSSYVIEVERAHTHLYRFPVIPSSRIDQSLKKIVAGRIDAFIFAAKETDDVIEKLGLQSKISKYLHKKYEVKIVLPKGKKGIETNKILSSVIGRLKASGKHQEIFAPITTYYDNWTPSQ